MNYAGKFDAALSLDGHGLRTSAYDHVDSFTAKAHGHVPDGAVVIADPNLIFNGEFKRTGLDLVLSHDGHEFVVHDYFRGDKRAAIASPDGAHLTGDIVSALTGYVQVAQAAPGAAAAQVIGHVTKLTGSATAIRNGVSVILNNGDNVEKGDVVSTGSDSTLGVTFIDGTVFGLSSNARMVLNEMVYDPNGSNNSSLLSLVAGTITFVAGETAKHGDMKIDTPVATMGIRGTAVLTEINFVVPSGGGDPQPQANFQVLVEPNGTTGSYILFDKLTLLPIATVNQAGQMVQISGGNVSVTNALLSPDVQKLITDVFTLKFTDNNTNTKLTTNFTDTITQNGNIVFIKTDTGATATATFTNTANNGTGTGQDGANKTADRFPGPPQARSLDLNGGVTSKFKLTEHSGTTADRSDATGDTVNADTVSGRITFVDLNIGDRPTVSVNLAQAPNFVYENADQQDVTGSLTALQIQDIVATQIQISVVPDAANTNNGSAVWTYTIPDHVFDFLAAGETLTLTYTILVNDNFSVNPESFPITIAITITGTNDKPVITTSVPTITFSGGTSVPGGPLTTNVPTSGTLTFSDVDLTDTHTVSVSKFSAVLPDGTVPKAISDFLANALLVSIASGNDSTGTGTGTINWSLKDIPVYLADFIPKGEVLTLTYTVTVTDSQGATADQTITVTITGTDAPAVVWIATNAPGAPAGGFWKDGANWETGTVPTIDDDVIVITDQLHGLTPSYPVTIDAAAYAKSITMNDFGGPPPQLINKSTLTIAQTLTMSADSILNNFKNAQITVGNSITITGTASFTNAGTLTLLGTTDGILPSDSTIDTLTTVTNSGLIELSGGTLALQSNVNNAGGTFEIDAAMTLHGATITGGMVRNDGTFNLTGSAVLKGGVLTNTATGLILVPNGAASVISTLVNSSLPGLYISGTGNSFENEAVTNSGSILVSANGVLTLDQGTTVANTGSIFVDISGILIIDDASIGGTGVLQNNGEVDLTGAAALSGGNLWNNSTVKVGGTGNALNDEAIINAGTIEVLANAALAMGQGSTADNAGGNVIVDDHAVLTLNGATISGGAVKGDGSIDVTGASKIDGGATLSVATVTADAALTLDGIAVSGSVITDHASIELDNTVKLLNGVRIQSGPVTNNGTLEIAGAATLLNDIVTNNGTVKIDDGQTLTLSGSEISGGTIDDFSGASGGAIDVTGDSTIDAHATLNKGAVTVESDVTLTFGDATVSSTAIANGGTVKVETGKKLALAGATLTGGTLTIAGTLASSGITTVTDANISNSYLIEAIGGLLMLTATTSTPAISNDGGTIRANSGELDINSEAVTNTGALTAINDGTLKLIATTVTNTGGAVSIESGSTLDLSGATIHGGTLTIAGTLESTGTSAITDADIANTGTISATSGTLTIDPAVLHTITNSHLLQANGGELDISGEHIVNTADIKAIGGGILKLTSLTVTNNGGTVTVDGTSKLYLTDVAINGGSLNNSGSLYSVSGSNGVAGVVTNTGTIEVQAGTLNLSGGLTGAGTLIIDDGATLELGGADAQTVTFAGGTDTLRLDEVAGQSFTGTIAGTSSKDGTFTITGAANISTSIGNALEFNASGGTSDGGGNIVLTPTGTLTGHDNGIVATQNGIGDITLTTSGDVTGQGGNGIVLHDSATGAGNIAATIGGGVSGAAGLDVVSHGGGAVNITNNGHITGTTSFGIHVDQDDSGATGSTHIINTGSVVGANGFAAISIDENATGTALIDNSGTIGPAAAGSVTSTTYAIVETGGAITINNSDHINGNISVASATFNNQSGGTWTVSGISVFGTLSTIDNAGEIDLLNGASVSSADGVTFAITNSGEIESWGTAVITGAITTTDTSAIEVHAGTLKLYGTLSGSGTVTIDAGATLDVDATVSQTITFGGDGAELQIDTTSFSGSVAGFAATDKLDLSSIVYDAGTSATYDPLTGDLVVSDAYNHTITVKLVGADYSNAHLAGSLSSDGHGGTLITYNAADDTPAFNPAETSQSAVVAEQSGLTGSSTLDQSTPASGTIHFTDVDLTDRPTATITEQSATWLASDGHTELTLTSGQASALGNALAVLTTGKNNGAVDWSYSIKDSALDFLGEGQTATVVSTITLDDHHGGTDTAQVTVTITGANDAPTLSNLNIGTLTDTAAADSFSDLTGKLAGADADAGETATLTYAVLNADHHATTTVAGLYGSLTVAADGSYSYVPNAAAIDALSAGNYTDSFVVQTTDVHGATGTATLTVGVTGADDAPVINVDNISVIQLTDEQIFVQGLTVTDADAAANETFMLQAATAELGSNVSPSTGSGSLADINAMLGTVTYNEGTGEPATDKVTLTVTDGHGATDTLNLIFNLRESGDGSNVALAGTSGKDVFFGTVGSDQFVFGADSNHDTIVNFTSGEDRIDLTAVVTTSNMSDWMAQHVSASPTNPADTLITIDAADTIVLKGVTHLSATDILHA
ncbi:VCBS domain-containing protein [Bradyrhizobium manausense]|uniref:VCBS domain-containing protein n=1 Tax=Bradyrhizobium manausense TaxID=989370 RepID=UPI001BA836C1|nr:VCBS domain-containing protein [Bradyrhizobium manausense]MBR0723314.1 VCBS domain-containing protein [Bradyrhizobium manausense]